VAVAGVTVRHLAARQAQSTHVNGLVSQLWRIDVKHLPRLLDELERQPDFWRQDVAEVAGDSSRALEDRTRAHLALARSDSSGLDFLRNRLLEADAAEHQLIRDELKRWKEHLTPALWRTAQDAQTPPAERLRATIALAEYDPESLDWNLGVATRIAQALVNMDPLLVNPWVEPLRAIRGHLLKPLADVFSDSGATTSQRLLAASVIARFAADDEQYLSPDLLCELVMDADPAQTAVLFPVVRMHRARVIGPLIAALDTSVPPVSGAQNERQIERQANAAETILRMGHDERFWPLLKQSADPRLRTALIDRLTSAEVGWKAALDRLDREIEGTIRQAIVLGLDAFAAGLSERECDQIATRLTELYVTDPDGGVHSAIEWVLGRWGFAEQVNQMKRQLAGQPAGARKWFVNSQLQTMLVIDAPGTFKIGSPDDEPGRDSSEFRRDATVSCAFAISAHEVTIEQIERSGIVLSNESKVGEGNRPAGFVKWFEAVQYCRWISEGEGISEEEQCYPDRYSIGTDTKLAPGYLTRAGYRLPTPQEWEYAARAGSTTSRFFGNSERLLEKYACYAVNSSDQTSPVGQFRPNPLGLFDVYGNVSEWCDAGISPFEASAREHRGGGYRSTPKFLRSAMFEQNMPDNWFSFLGFRMVKTIRVESR
jgi:formylglycine-generating enzyme required for sulfatase activity